MDGNKSLIQAATIPTINKQNKQNNCLKKDLTLSLQT